MVAKANSRDLLSSRGALGTPQPHLVGWATSLSVPGNQHQGEQEGKDGSDSIEEQWGEPAREGLTGHEDHEALLTKTPP